MTVFPVLLKRLFERRFLRDGGSDASLLPGALTTLAISSLVASLVVGELADASVARIVVIAVTSWSLLRTVLENRELEDEDLDDRVLTPLPIRAIHLLAARAVVVAVGVTIDALNVALPAAVWMGARSGLSKGLLLLLISLFAALFGFALASALRRIVVRLVPPRTLAQWEGPAQLGAALLVLVAVIRAPHLDLSALDRAPFRYLPPLSFSAATFDGASGIDIVAAVLSIVLSLLLLAFAVTGRARRFGARTATSRAASGRTTEGGPLVLGFARTLDGPIERAGFHFALAQMKSDRVFRQRSYPLFAFPFAAIVLAGSDAADPTLVPMAFFGATVYLVLAEVFFSFSESVLGPALLRTLPIGDVASLRVGAEKAYIAALVTPVHIALGFGALALDVVRKDGASFVQHFLLAVIAWLTSVVIVLLTFEKQPFLPFSVTDRALYPSDVAGGAYAALLIATIGALVTVAALPHPLVVLVQVVVLVLMIRQALRWKKTRQHPAQT